MPIPHKKYKNINILTKCPKCESPNAHLAEFDEEITLTCECGFFKFVSGFNQDGTPIFDGDSL